MEEIGEKKNVESFGDPIGSSARFDYSVERSFERVSGLI
jgi:hypothetical protein